MAHGDRADEVLVRVLQLPVAPGVVEVPDADRFVVGAGEQELAGRMEDEACHPVVMSDERRYALSRLDVPDLERFVPTCAGHELLNEL